MVQFITLYSFLIRKNYILQICNWKQSFSIAYIEDIDSKHIEYVNFVDNNLHGKSLMFRYENGKIIILSNSYSIVGILHGYKMEWYSTGINLWEVLIYRDGLVKAIIKWDIFGKLILYISGKRHFSLIG